MRVTGKTAKAISAELATGKRGDLRTRLAAHLELDVELLCEWLVVEHQPLERIVHVHAPAFDVVLRDEDEFWETASKPQVVWTRGKLTRRARGREDEVATLTDHDLVAITDFEPKLGGVVLGDLRWHGPMPTTKRAFAIVLERASNARDLPQFDPSPVASGTATASVGMTYLGGPDRANAFEGSFAKSPKRRWLANGGGDDEQGGHVVVDGGLAVTGNSITGTFAGFDVARGNKRWTRSVPGHRAEPRSSAAIANGVVYMASRLGLHALDAKTGRPRWLAKLTEPAGAPLVLGELVIIPGKGGLHAVSISNGRRVWTIPVKGACTGSPAWRDGVIYFIGGTNLYAIDAATTKVRWKQPVGREQRHGPVLVGESVIYTRWFAPTASKNGGDGVVCADRTTGKQRWQRNVDVGAHALAVGGGRILGKDGEGRLCAVTLDTGKLVWSADAKIPHPSGIGSNGPAIVGDTVVSVMVGSRGDDGDDELSYLCGFAIRDGKLRWKLDKKVLGSSKWLTWSWHGSPCVGGDTLYAHGFGLVALR
jgi:outer membrane protein assembly factor BamB